MNTINNLLNKIYCIINHIFIVRTYAKALYSSRSIALRVSKKSEVISDWISAFSNVLTFASTAIKSPGGFCMIVDNYSPI